VEKCSAVEEVSKVNTNYHYFITKIIPREYTHCPFTRPQDFAFDKQFGRLNQFHHIGIQTDHPILIHLKFFFLKIEHSNFRLRSERSILDLCN
jgi:hypothetical protein